ncbi:BnaA10g28340D [Brassica napus]|uniref:NAD(P)H dehydrogenase (quinone) n=1 Tax=Brassica napus TaxID=3708 RepID=A0A078IH79_BRANA|nr:BnaA10g28340D [Brassica napus]
MWICLFTIRVCDFFFVHSDNDCGCINIDEGVPVIGMVLVYMFCDRGISNSEDIVPETLPEEALSKMSTPPKSESPIITPDELTEADGFVFGFPTRYGMMAAQFKVFLDTTGGLRRTQSLAGKPDGSSTALALKVVAKKPLHTVVNDISSPLKDQSAHVYIICDGGNIEGFATKMTEPQPKYSTTEKQVLDML